MAINSIQGTDGIRGPVSLAEKSSSPGPIEALLNEGILTEELFELYTYSFCQELLDMGFATINDITNSILFLLDNNSSYINGANIKVGGGWQA